MKKLCAVTIGILFALSQPADATPRKASDALLALSDLPEGYSENPVEARSGKCNNLTGVLKKGSSSTGIRTFDSDSRSVAHIVGVYPDVTKAKAAMSALTKWSTDCKTEKIKADDGTKITLTVGAMNFVALHKPDQIAAWKRTADTVNFSAALVAYRKGAIVGVIGLNDWSVDVAALKQFVDKAIAKAA